MKKIYITSIFLTAIIFSLNTIYTSKPTMQIHIVFDASKSMLEKIQDESKLDIGKKTLYALLKRLMKNNNIKTGLRVYGHLNKSCTGNTSLEIPMGYNNALHLRRKVNGIQAKGKTPLAYALQQAEKDFDKNIPGQKVIILVTDGIESCNGNPCATATYLNQRGIVDKIHVIGLGMKPSHFHALKCIASPSGSMLIKATGKYGLRDAFLKVIAKITDKNLIVISKKAKNKPVKAVVSIYQNGSKLVNMTGNETHFALNPGKYDIKAVDPDTGMILWERGVNINPLSVTIRELKFRKAKLKITSKDFQGNSVTSNIVIFLSGSKYKISKADGTGIHEIFVTPGKYDIKIVDYITKVSKRLKSVKINDGDLKNVDVLFERGYMRINAENSWQEPANIHVEIYTLTNPQVQAGAKGRRQHNFTLMPGTYNVKVVQPRARAVMWIKNVKIRNGKIVRFYVRQLPAGRWYVHDVRGNWVVKQ